MSINKSGEIAGSYTDNSNAAHGLLRAFNGKLSPFDAPSAGSGSHQGTFALAINDTGVVSGNYIDSTGASHGFIRHP